MRAPVWVVELGDVAAWVRHFFSRAHNKMVAVATVSILGALGATEAGVSAAADIGSERVVLAIIGLALATVTGMIAVAKLLISWLNKQQAHATRSDVRVERDPRLLDRVLDLMGDNVKRIETRIEASDLRVTGQLSDTQRSISALMDVQATHAKQVSLVQTEQAKQGAVLERLARKLLTEG